MTHTTRHNLFLFVFFWNSIPLGFIATLDWEAVLWMLGWSHRKDLYFGLLSIHVTNRTGLEVVVLILIIALSDWGRIISWGFKHLYFSVFCMGTSNFYYFEVTNILQMRRRLVFLFISCVSLATDLRPFLHTFLARRATLKGWVELSKQQWSRVGRVDVTVFVLCCSSARNTRGFTGQSDLTAHPIPCTRLVNVSGRFEPSWM